MAEGPQPAGNGSAGTANANKTVPFGAEIWNSSSTWVTVKEWHPAGVISNAHNGAVEWADDVSFMSLKAMLVLSTVAYPAICVVILLMLTVLVSMCLSTKEEPTKDNEADSGCSFVCGKGAPKEEEEEDCRFGSNRDPLYNPPVLPKECLTANSRVVYGTWAFFCCLIPSMMVFGMPALMMCLARPYPQEVFGALTLLTSAFIFSNGVYMAIFAGSAIVRMHHSMAEDFRDAGPQRGRHGGHQKAASAAAAPGAAEGEAAGRSPRAVHWVLLPQYKESFEVVAMALKSISASTVASDSISVVLAMEKREGVGANVKAEQLRRRFEGEFREIIVTYHPTGLPDDPPGKASNLAWAFKELMSHLSASGGDLTKVILTVADADSEFHAGYFEALTQLSHQAGSDERHLRIWQAPVFHLKNYHRQPGPVVVGTMFTCMQELAGLSDPNAVRFPYSTYSLSLDLARQVGGWDADWIAEDYHMGIKCFLFTLGRVRVEPILLPTVNYTPEGETWLGTVWARWTQAKRHALGFSDLSYYFMMLPLIFSYAGSRKSGLRSLQAFWSMATYGVTLLVRLINIHVLIGILSTYGFCTSILRMTMLLLFSRERNVGFLFSRTNFCPHLLMVSSLLCTVLVSVLFITVYNLMRDRIEGQGVKATWWASLAHWIQMVVCILLFGPFYFLGLGFAIWKAALSVALSHSFEYEVAPKPTAALRLGAAG